MSTPSNNETRFITMFDSFRKTAARNFSRNLKRVKETK